MLQHYVTIRGQQNAHFDGNYCLSLSLKTKTTSYKGKKKTNLAALLLTQHYTSAFLVLFTDVVVNVLHVIISASVR